MRILITDAAMTINNNYVAVLLQTFAMAKEFSPCQEKGPDRTRPCGVCVTLLRPIRPGGSRPLICIRILAGRRLPSSSRVGRGFRTEQESRDVGPT